MRKLTLTAAAFGAAFLFTPAANAAGDLSRQNPIVVRLDLGIEGVEKHRFAPDKLTFETGKLYKLVIHNPSNSLHEIDVPDFYSKEWTRKVEVMDDIGPGAKMIAEIKMGTIGEIEVAAGGTVEWYFIPVGTGTFEMVCDTKDKDGKTHTEKGMKGTITVK